MPYTSVYNLNKPLNKNNNKRIEFLEIHYGFWSGVDAPGLKDRDRVRYWRHEIILQLEEYVEHNVLEPLPHSRSNDPSYAFGVYSRQFASRSARRGRLGEILLLLNSVRTRRLLYRLQQLYSSLVDSAHYSARN